MSIAEDLLRITVKALEGCTPNQQRAYRLVEGINEQGEPTTPTPVGEAARRLGSNHSNLIHTVNAARVEVLTAICAHLYEIARSADDQPGVSLVEAVGSSTIDESELQAHFTISKHRRGSTIRLGEGSEAMTLAAKRHTAEERRSATIDAHVRYSDAGKGQA